MIVNEYRKTGIVFAIDDFGAGYAGLNLLADFQPDIIKLDMHLIRQVHSKGRGRPLSAALSARALIYASILSRKGLKPEMSMNG
ncbi:MAG: EAL domain-containing protein [Desulfobacterales bacterium]